MPYRYPQFVNSPIDGLRIGGQLIIDNPIFLERYNNYVSPMVYADTPVNWAEALEVFVVLSNAVLAYAEECL